MVYKNVIEYLLALMFCIDKLQRSKLLMVIIKVFARAIVSLTHVIHQYK
jgi:hypothetical protein